MNAKKDYRVVSGVEMWHALMEMQTIGICSHARPDGDAIGSQLALAELLIAIGKEVVCFNVDGLPERFRFLTRSDLIKTSATVPEGLDCLVLIECADVSRAGIPIPPHLPLMNIDHHITESYYGVMNWVDPTAPCVGVMLLELQEQLNLPATKSFYENCYVALLSDTGGFSYNLSARAFRAAARILEAGIDARRIQRHLFANHPFHRFVLLGMVLQTLERSDDGLTAWIRVTPGMLQQTGATYFDMEGFVDIPLQIENVEVSAFFKEIEPGHFRVSLRSNGIVDVLPIAKHFHGGGHKFAAAFTWEGTWDELRKEVLPVIIEHTARFLAPSPTV